MEDTHRPRYVSLVGVVISGITAVCIGTVACASMSARDDAVMQQLHASSPVSDEQLAQAIGRSPDDEVWFALEQAFALLRKASSDKEAARARSFLEQAFTTFEDLRDPENFSVAFTADEDTPYRGRPHERVLAATTLALLDAANGRCDLALPTLRAAEFLDVRWQKLAFGTDAALVYAAALYCLGETKGRAEDVQRAEQGLALTLRYQAAAEPMRALLRRAADAAPRHDAVAVSLATQLLELGVMHALATEWQAKTAEQILREGASATAVFAGRLDELLEADAMVTALDQARVASGGAIGRNRAEARDFVKNHLRPAIDEVAVLVVGDGDSEERTRLDDALRVGARATDEVKATLRHGRVHLRLSGRGPEVLSTGTYGEVAQIKARDDNPTEPSLPRRPVTGTAPCGVRGDGASIRITLCTRHAQGESSTPPTEALELWSSTVQATSVVGRRFDQILAGRAAFRASADAVSTVAAYSAFTLWRVGLELLAECGGPGDGEDEQKRKAKRPAKNEEMRTCLAVAGVTLAAGGVVAGAGGVVWLAGKTVNPSADVRFVHNLPERAELWLSAAASEAHP
ncbi:MAG: hypothetical protein ACO3JL_08530 [Myxococcota bacterium]